MPPEIRHPVVAEAADFLRSVNTTYLEPGSKDASGARFWLDHIKPDLDRTWGAFDRGRAVGSLRSLPFELTVPGGGTVPADGISMVSVAATHRRRGLLTGLIGAALAAAIERGDAVSVLMASEWPIYGRYGYGPATEAAEWKIDKLRAGARSPQGDLEYVTAAELRALAPPVYDRAREAAGGTGRQRPWQVVERATKIDGDELGPEAKLAADALLQLLRERDLQRLRVYGSTRDDYPKQWRDAAHEMRLLMHLTAAELAELFGAVESVLAPYLEKNERRPGTLPVSFGLHMVPTRLPAGSGDDES